MPRSRPTAGLAPAADGRFRDGGPADAGSAIVRRRDLRGDGVIRLQPWARVSGTVMLDGKPAANLELSVRSRRAALRSRASLASSMVYVETGRRRPLRAAPRHAGAAGPRAEDAQRRGQPHLVQSPWRRSMSRAAGPTTCRSAGAGDASTAGYESRAPGCGWSARRRSSPKCDRAKRRRRSASRSSRRWPLPRRDLPPGEHMLRIAIHEPPPDDACGWGRLIAAYTAGSHGLRQGR